MVALAISWRPDSSLAAKYWAFTMPTSDDAPAAPCLRTRDVPQDGLLTTFEQHEMSGHPFSEFVLEALHLRNGQPTWFAVWSLPNLAAWLAASWCDSTRPLERVEFGKAA